MVESEAAVVLQMFTMTERHLRLLPAFFTQDVALFRFRGTRRMCVAEEVFGEGDHIGVLVRDRFPGYDNSFKGKRQYCFEHLKRDCKELLEKEPQNAEYHREDLSMGGES
ncbi:MAG: transposase [Kiritimatiellia bacterium]